MAETVAIYFALILARVGTFVAIMPLFADRAPRVVRAGLALALAVFYFSAVGPRWDAGMASAVHANALSFGLSLGREALIGAAMGFAFSLFLLPAQIAGSFISQQIGLAAGPIGGPTGQTGAGPLGVAFEIMASLIFLQLDGHHVLLAALHASFAKFPLGGMLLPQPTGQMVAGLARAQELGVLLASPVAFCLFLLTIVLAFMARVAPQLNIITIGFTLQSIVALLGVAFLLPDIVRLMSSITGTTGVAVMKFLG
jgi:flagellar biosynthesis protein FliR